MDFNQPTREIFHDISPLGEALFYTLAFLSVGVCFYGLYRRYRLWRRGVESAPSIPLPERVRAFLTNVLAQKKVRRRKRGGILHLLIFYGFVALFIGTTIVAIEDYGGRLAGFNHAKENWFFKGDFFLAYKLTLDLFGFGVLVGCAMAFWRRYVARPRSLGHNMIDGWLLALITVAAITGFALEGARIAHTHVPPAIAQWSPVGARVALLMGWVTHATYPVVWWTHMAFIFGLFASFPWARLRHVLTIPLVAVQQPERPNMGALRPITMEEVEQTGRIGVGAANQFTRWQLMSVDACMNCGRCTEVCPANAVGKVLDPQQVVFDIRRSMAGTPDAEGNIPLEGVGLSEEAIWACTTCNACVRECPALIRHVDLISDIRRFWVAEGKLAGSAATALRQMTGAENPWGLPAAERETWAQGLDIPRAYDGAQFDVLLWVGCAGAFNRSNQSTNRAVAELLKAAGVKFAILGKEEKCTGDPARRIGDEFLYQTLAEQNIAVWKSYGVKKIVASCPHCFNTILKEYPAFGGDFEVVHHTQFLAELIESGTLKIGAEMHGRVTLHDPCYLARINKETEAPRKALNVALKIPLTEVARRGEKTFCCGAGGGRMWMEEPPNQRPGKERAQELIATGAQTVAVACPFCRIMVGDSLAQVAGDNAPQVLDVAEVLLQGLAKPQVIG